MKKAIEEGVKVKGHYRLIYANPELAPQLYRRIIALIDSGMRKTEPKRFSKLYNRMVEKYHSIATVKVLEYDNLPPTAGLNVLARQDAGDTTYSPEITHVALGDDTTSPTIGDTTLGNETFRQAVTDARASNNVAYMSCFIGQGSATGTHYEAGAFRDGTGTVDTGQIASHVLFSPPVAKGALNSLTIEITMTYSG